VGRKNEYLKIRYRHPSKSGKTKIWKVTDNANVNLGDIKWYAHWRCYALFPLGGTIWEEDCLREIADFCRTQSRQIRHDWAKRRK